MQQRDSEKTLTLEVEAWKETRKKVRLCTGRQVEKGDRCTEGVGEWGERGEGKAHTDRFTQHPTPQKMIYSPSWMALIRAPSR